MFQANAIFTGVLKNTLQNTRTGRVNTEATTMVQLQVPQSLQGGIYHS